MNIHNPNFCCACGLHIKKEEWYRLKIVDYIAAEDGFTKAIQLRMCPNCKCVQGE